MDESIVLWALGLIVGFPIATVALGEGVERLQRSTHPLTPFFRTVRRYMLPALAILLVMRQILGFTNADMSMRIIETIYWIFAMQTCLSLLNAVLTTGTKQKSWQIYVPKLFFQVARALVVLCIASYMLANLWEVDLSQLAAALGVGSLVIALALQDTLSNLVSGFLLLFESPFSVGDWLRIGDLEGEVIDMNWRAVRLKTDAGDAVIIPNGVLGKEVIYNITLLDPMREASAIVRFSYQDSPNRVRRVLEETALATQGILADPAPQVLTLSFDDFAITYQINFFITDLENEGPIRSELITRIYYTAKRHNLRIPLPTRTLYHIESSPDNQDDTLKEILAYLRSLSYFISIDMESLKQLASDAIKLDYGSGEVVIKRGDPDQGFYIIIEGRVQISVTDIHGREQEVASVGSGDFFGELTLHSEEASPVSVTVLEDLQVIIIPDESITSIVQRNPKFAIEMNQFIQERQIAVRRLEGIKNI